MSLSLGTLTGFLDLDASEFDSALGGAESELSGFGGKGAAIAAAAGLAIGAAIAAGVLGAMNVEAANDKLSAQLGLTAAESERVGGVAGALYANAYGSSLSEVNTAVGAVMSSIGGMSTASSADLQKVSANALDFASIFDMDVTAAANAAGLAITNGLAKDGTQAFDLLTASLQQVPAAMREGVMEASNEYAGFFSALGIKGPQAFGLLVAGAQTGEQGLDKVGDSLKEFSLNSIDLGKNGEVYKQLGLDGRQMANDILAGGDIAGGATQKIISGLLGIKDPTDQAAAAISLFGTPLEDMGVTNIPAFLTSLDAGAGGLQNFEGAIDSAGATLNNNASTNIESFKRQVMTTFVDFVGGQALPIVNSMASALAVGFGPALSAVGTILAGFGAAVQAATGWLSQHQTTTTVLAGIITAVLIPTLVGLAVSYATTAAAAVSSAATQSAAWLATQVRALGTGAVLLVSYSLQVAGWVSMGVAAVANAAVVVASWVLMGTQSLIQAARVAAAWLIAMGPIGLVIAAVIAVVVLIVKNWDTIRAKTEQLWNAVKAVTGAAWDWIKNAVTTAVNAVKAVIIAVFGAIQTAITTYFNVYRAIITTAWDVIKSVTTTAVNAVRTVVTTVFDGIRSAITTYVNVWRTVITTAWDVIRTVVSGAVNAVRGVVTGGFDAVVGAIRGAMSAAQGVVSGAWNAIRGIVAGAVGAVIGAIGGLAAIPGRVGGFFNSARDAAAGALGGLLGVVRGLPGQVSGALGNLGGVLLGAGRSVIDGFIRGIQNGFAAVRNTLSSLTSMLPSWKGPPSRDAMILRDAGQLVMGGFESGLRDRFGNVRQALGDVTDLLGMSVAAPDFVQTRLGIDPGRGAAAGAAGSLTGPAAPPTVVETHYHLTVSARETVNVADEFHRLELLSAP